MESFGRKPDDKNSSKDIFILTRNQKKSSAEFSGRNEGKIDVNPSLSRHKTDAVIADDREHGNVRKKMMDNSHRRNRAHIRTSRLSLRRSSSGRNPRNKDNK